MWRHCCGCALAILGCCFGRVATGEVTSSVIVVCPGAWGNALDAWSMHRQGEYRIIRIDTESTATKLKQAILREVSQAQIPVSAVLLCGDVGLHETILHKDSKSGQSQFTPITPTFVVPTKVMLGPFTTPTLATDGLYGDLDNDGCPDLAVGRLPAKNGAELSRMLQRSIDYETSQSFGPWRDRIHATAGVGGFGVLADTAIESVARRLLSEGIPDRFQLNMTYASLTSPYCPAPNALTPSFIGKINQGGLFWVYIGHGNIDELDYLSVLDEKIPICSSQDVSRFSISDGPPIAILLACFAGAFDAKVDCFAELLLAQQDGPIAVISGSRVTMPYGLSQLSTEMMDGCFRDRTPTLGAIVLNAKHKIWKEKLTTSSPNRVSSNPADRFREQQQAMIETMAKALSPEDHSLLEERREHVRLMNLLGDPLLRIRQPIELALDCLTDPLAGSTLTVSGSSPIAGRLRLELVLSRDRLPEGLRPLNEYRGTPDELETMQSNYERASDLVLAHTEQQIAEGPFSLDIMVPATSRGRCVVRAFVYADDDWSSGSKRVNVRRPKT